MSNTNEHAEEPEINEILLDDMQETVLPTQPRRQKKHFVIPCIPRMYWFMYRKPIQIILFLPALASSWINTYSTLTMARILDCLNEPDAVSQVKRLGLTNFLVACVAAVLDFVSTYTTRTVGDSIIMKARCFVFKEMMKKDVEFFDRKTIGDMLSLLNEDVNIMARAFSWSKAWQLRILGMLVSNVIVSFAIDWRLSLFAIVSTGVVGIASQLFKQVARKQWQEARHATTRSVTIADECISQVRIVQAFNRQKKEVERYKAEADEYCARNALAQVMIEIGFGLTRLMDWGTVAVCLNIGCYFVIKGQLTAGNLFALSRTAFQIGSGLNMMMSSYAQEQRALESSGKVFEVIDEVPGVPFDGGRVIPGLRGEIELQNVWFKYPTRNAWVMRDVSMHIDPGQIVALVGHSGSGKSTLVQLLLRYYDINQGRILIDGVDIKELDPRWLHQVIGVVQQEPILFAMSVRDNILYGFDEGQSASDEEIWRTLEMAQAKGFVSKLPDGLNTLCGEKGALLSGGQKQRIAIARTTITNPAILITDEATSALDSRSEKKVQAALDRVMGGRTSIIIAHRLGTIKSASKIFVFESGQLVEEGNHDELIAKHGVFYTLVERQLQTKSPQ